jgi:transcriptional regulator with XRE-family HTH domain
VTLPLLATEIHRLRTANGLTLDQLANRARISRSTLVKIESGKTPDPGFSVAARLLAAAGANDEQVLTMHCAAVRAWSPRVLGLGYEGLDQQGLIERLKQERVQVVADVRLTPLSRKKGLSKKALAEQLAEAGIDYVHFRALGNPKDNRSGYGDPRDRGARRAFAARLQGEEARQQLAQLRHLGEDRVVAVLCFEQDEKLCHREQVLAALDGA